MTGYELWADAYLFIVIFYFMLLIVLDAGEENDFQMRRFFISLQHSCTWNANFNQLFAGKMCNRSAISAGFPFILVSAVEWRLLEETWILCKEFRLFVSTLWQGLSTFLMCPESNNKY